MCKTMEKLVREIIVKHMSANKLFSNKQFGFISGRSTTLQLLQVMDGRSLLCGTLSKAFIKSIYTESIFSPLSRILIHSSITCRSWLSATISKPITIIFNSSMCQSLVPQLWKEVNITALFKKGDKAEPGNYRPVSLISVICKTLFVFCC
jgi:hypothetical protein